jgi:hypothetical protein
MSDTLHRDATVGEISDQDISDAYIYLLGRLLITRQQQVDFDEEGFQGNRLLHRKPGQVDWPNPNLDVAYSEAWVVLDENSCLLVTVPEITGRYYTVEFLNGWGETLANINEREFADHPNGLFAVVLKGSNVATPQGAQRLELPEKVTRVLARVELGADWDEAVALQRQFKFEIQGNPTPPNVPRTVVFDMEALPGVEAFESAALALDSYPDTNSGMAQVQAKARAIADAVKDPAERERVDRVIKQRALRDFAAASPNIGHGTVRNNWARPAFCGHFGDDWLTRTLVNFAGIWANTFDEVIYYKGNLDGDGRQINADNQYTLTFPADDLPAKYARYFWSIIAVDTKHMRVLPNPMNKFLLNKESGLQYADDGSLILYFGPQKPADAPESNWLPTLGGKDYRFTFRFYGPLGGVADGTYFPPPVIRHE